MSRERAWVRSSVLAAAGFTACIESTSTAPSAIATLTIVAPDTAVLVSHTLQLRAVARDANGRVVQPTRLAWSSPYAQYLGIDSTGLATALQVSYGSNDFPVIATAFPDSVSDTQVVHIARRGDVKWRLPLGSMPIEGGPAQGPDGTLYVLGAGDLQGQSSTLYAVSPKGTIKWQRRLAQVNGSNYAVIGTDGSVYVVGQYVWAYASDGTLRWADTLRPIENLPNLPDSHAGALSTVGVLYAAMGYDLLAFRIGRGDTAWQGPRATDGGWLLPPTTHTDGSTAYIKNTGDSLYAFRATDGAIQWATPDLDSSANNISYGVGPAVAGTRIVIPLSSRLEEVDASGSIVGRGPSCGLGMSEPAIAPDGTLYVQFDNCDLQAYNPITTQQWVVPLSARWTWYGGPALAQNGWLYTAAWDGFYAFDVITNSTPVRVWRFPASVTDSLAFVGAPLIGPDGTVYTFTSCNYGRDVGTFPCSDELFAFWGDFPPEPSSPWPMWRHDARRSGQADR